MKECDNIMSVVPFSRITISECFQRPSLKVKSFTLLDIGEYLLDVAQTDNWKSIDYGNVWLKIHHFVSWELNLDGVKVI